MNRLSDAQSIALAALVALSCLAYNGAMAEIPTHQQTATPAEHLAAWKDGGIIAVPTRKGGTMNLSIHLLIEATAINGRRVDAVIHARASKRGPMRVFAVVFSEDRPLDEYPIRVLWVSESSSAWIEVE